MRLPHFAAPLVVLLCLRFAGCSPAPDPWQIPLSTATPSDFASATDRLARRLSRGQMQEFEECVVEFKTRIVLDKAATGSDAVHALACRQLNGLTPYQVLLKGYELKIARYAGDISVHQGNLDGMTRRHFELGRSESSLKSNDHYINLVEHIAKLNSGLEKARERLAELQKTPPVVAHS
ncbi:MAG: hypothetical protein LBC18_09550 [Opitutaceae bacterium]|jgi:hypothetical protein|nr:hypothetical protein [Opitutaceae bacterium]